jgi:hypothetical protein
MIVPDNTYVLNLATAGKACMKLDRFLDDLIYEKDEAAANNPLAAAGAGEEPASQLERLYTAIRDRTFLRDAVAIADHREHIGEAGTTVRNRQEQYVNTSGMSPIELFIHEITKSPAMASLAYYEPGDIMHDTSLHTMNNYLPLLLLGVYRIPVPFVIKKAVFDASKPVLLPTATINTIDRNNINNTKPVMRATEDHHQIFNRDENLIRRQMFPDAGPPVPKLFLSEIIDHTNRTVNDGKNHFFMVKACRSAPDSATSRLARRFSIAARADRERIGVDPAVLAARPAARYRSVLNRAFLDRVSGALTRRVPVLQTEKTELEAEEAAAQALPKTNETRRSTLIRLDREIANKDRDIREVQEGIAILNRILTRTDPFTMRDIKTALKPAKEGLQEEFVELLDL